MPQLLTLPAHWWAIVYLPQDEFITRLLLSTSATGPGAEMLLLIFWAYYGLTHRVKMRFENVVELAAHPEPLHTRSTWYQNPEKLVGYLRVMVPAAASWMVGL